MFSITPGTEDGQLRLRLEGDLSLYQVAQAREQLLALTLPAARHWQLDLSGIGEFDSAGAQWLLALQRHLGNADGPARVIGAPPSVRELLELLRLETLYPPLSHEG